MLVSVVIPCHNSLRYLPETLDSVLDQRLPSDVELEVVLVDDGGDDDLGAWTATRGDERVRCIRQENTGVAGARNRGIEESSGDMICFCDSDDLWVPTTVADLLACFDRDPGIGLAYGWYEVVDGDGAPTGAVRSSDLEGWAWERLVTENPVGASGVMVPRTVLDEVGVFEVNRDRFRIDVEDWELWIRIAAEHRIGLAPTVVYRYRRHDSNSSSDVASIEAAYAHLFDVVFDGVSAERARLRPEAEARADQILAWQALNDRQDPAMSLEYLARGVRKWPELKRRPDYWRLRAAATALRATGPRGYSAVRSANGAARKLRSRLGR